MSERRPYMIAPESPTPPCSPELHAQLAELIRKGSAEAFFHLIQDYKTPLFQFFFRLLSDRSGAEDSSEKVFLRAYRMRRLLGKGTDLSTWLFCIACNVLEDRDVKAILDRSVIGDSTIQQAMHAITVQQQIVVLLHRFAGLSSTQLGSVLRIPEREALKRIRESYKALQDQVQRLASIREPRGFSQ